MAAEGETDLPGRIAGSVLKSSKYRELDPGLVRRVVAREAGSRRASAREAEKAARRKLHQVTGAYLPGEMHYERWLAELRAAAADPQALRAACLRIMAHHASTQERLPLVPGFYYETLQGVAPPASVLDIACGLNPLAVPFMPMAPGARYYACDVYADMMEFVRGFLSLIGTEGEAEVRDVVAAPPNRPADLALILKAIPCLEQLDPDAGRRLLDAVNAPHLLISFPARSLGGRSKGMVVNYERRLGELLAGRSWRSTRYEYATELVFLVSR